MKNCLILTIMASVALTDCGSTRTPDGIRAETATETALASNVEAVAAQLASQDAFSGVVLLSHDGRTLLRRGFGLSDRAVGRPNTPETPFALASVSKMFTAVTIAKLVEQNRLSFDARLGSLLPAYPSAEAREQVTVHHLLTMSSGIPDLFRVPEFWAGLGTIKTLPDFWRYFARSPLQFRPGTRWAYSNSNFLLLGAIIEQVTGRPFTSVVEEQVISPLGLTATHYNFDPTRRPALGYTRAAPAGVHSDSARWYPAWEEPKLGGDFVVGSPMGGGYSTVDDLSRFAEALIAKRLLSPEMTARVLMGYIDAEYGGRDGYGFETRLVNGVRMAGHRGALAGTSNQVEFYPDLGYVLVVLGNTDGDAPEILAQRARGLITSSPHKIDPR